MSKQAKTRKNRRYVPFWWNGVMEYSVRKFADMKGVSIETVYSWLKKGYTCDADIQPVGRPPGGFKVSPPKPLGVLPPLRKFGKVKRINKIRSKIRLFEDG